MAVTALLSLTLQSPRRAAEHLLALRLPYPVLVQGLVLVCALSVLLTALGQGLSPRLAALPGGFTVTPFGYAGMLGAALVLLSLALSWGGRPLGGAGSFGSALGLVVWLELVACLLRLIQALLLPVSPELAGFLGLLATMWLLWCLIAFAGALHGFSSLARALGTVVVALLGLGLVLGLILSAAGLTPAGTDLSHATAPQNIALQGTAPQIIAQGDIHV